MTQPRRRRRTERQTVGRQWNESASDDRIPVKPVIVVAGTTVTKTALCWAILVLGWGQGEEGGGAVARRRQSSALLRGRLRLMMLAGFHCTATSTFSAIHQPECTELTGGRAGGHSRSLLESTGSRARTSDTSVPLDQTLKLYLLSNTESSFCCINSDIFKKVNLSICQPIIISMKI